MLLLFDKSSSKGLSNSIFLRIATIAAASAFAFSG
jgi:hypothetical protein